jgi:LemA protein
MMILTTIIILVFLGILFLYYFNKLVVLETKINEAFSNIDVQLKRRADLIPNLVEAVKGYMKHEKSAIKSVTDARKALISAKGFSNRVKADQVLEGALGKLFALAENYPDLKANTNFLELQRELSSTEDRIAYARQFYNDGIFSFNKTCNTFPGLLFAKIYGKEAKKFIEIPNVQREPVKVSF